MNTVIAAGDLISNASLPAGLSGVSSAHLNAAAQVAIWELAFDVNVTGGGSFTSLAQDVRNNANRGSFYVDGFGGTAYTNVTTIANRLVQGWLNAGRPNSPTGFINYEDASINLPDPDDRSQDQIYAQVAVAAPEPSLTILAASGALAFGLRRLVARRRPA